MLDPVHLPILIISCYEILPGIWRTPGEIGFRAVIQYVCFNDPDLYVMLT